MDIFAHWQNDGMQIRWRSTTAANDGAEVSVFSRRCGTPGAPALVCVHGFPTSSIDYFALARELESEFDIFVLDFPGYGLSDKPAAPYTYSLYDDARLLVHAITHEWRLTEYRMLAHDRGSSVAMIALGMLAAQDPPAVPDDLILTNANIYLPLANLTRRFRPRFWTKRPAGPPRRRRRPSCWRPGWGRARSCHDGRSRTRRSQHWHSVSRTTTGCRVLPDTIQYLHERAADETRWLEALSKNEVNISWRGACTTASRRCGSRTMCGSPIIRGKPGRSRYWVVPSADHYLQCDAPSQLAYVVRLTAEGENIPLQTLGDQPDGAVLVDQTTPGS